MTLYRNVIGYVGLFFVLLFLFFWQLNLRPLANPDEGRYTEIPREMMVSGDFVTPRLNGVKYFEKTPLFYWMQTVSFKIFGQNEWGGRFVNGLMALLGCLGTIAFARRFFSHRIALMSGALLGTMFLYVGMSHVVTLDMTVSLWITSALFSMAVGLLEKKRGWVLIGYGFCGLGMLTKGIIGFGFPGVIILGWILLQHWQQRDGFKGFFQKGSLFWRSLDPLGILLFLAIVTPWHLLVSLKNPEFAWFYFVHEHILRLLTKVHNRYQPFWFFMPILLLGLFPWTIAILRGMLSAWRKPSPLNSLLLLWPVIIFGVYSFSQSKLIPYLLPLLPPLAIIGAQFLDEIWKSSWRDHKFFVAVYILFLGLLGGTLLVVDIPASAQNLAYVLLGALLLFALTPFVVRSLGRWMFISGVAFTVAVMPWVNKLGVHVQRPTTKAASEVLKGKPHVGSFRFYPQDLPFYLGRTIDVTEWVGELSFGMSVEDTSGWMMSSDQMVQKWKKTQGYHVIMRRWELPAFIEKVGSVKEVFSDDTHVVVTQPEHP